MFKIGDKVKIIDSTYFFADYIGDYIGDYIDEGEPLIGMVFPIYNIDKGDNSICVIYNDEYYWFNSSDVELVEDKKETKKMKFIPMTDLEVISVNGIDGILIPE